MGRARGGQTRSGVAIATAAASALAMVAVGVIGLAFLAGRTRDAIMLHGFTGLNRSSLDSAIRELALSVNPVPFACVGLALVGVCIAQRRFWRAATVATVLIGSGATAQILKRLLAFPREPSFGDGFRPEDIGWPSGHAAAVTSLAIAAVIVAPPAWRGLVALGAGGYAVALGFATLALTWHYPSEVLGGILLAGIWGAAGLTVLARVEGPGPDTPAVAPPDWVIGWGTVGAVVAAAIAYAAAGSDPLAIGDRSAMGLCAFAIAMTTLGLLVTTIAAAPPDDAPEGHGAARRPEPLPDVAARDNGAHHGDLARSPGDRERRRPAASGRARHRR